jgi:cytochrome c-type biogenesis protein CcmH/NrfF
MNNPNDNNEPELRWMETPKGRAIINGVSLPVLLMITQHFGYIAPGPPVTFENFILYSGYGIAVGLLMYAWTDFRIKRQRKKREALKKSEQIVSIKKEDES